MVKIGYQQCSCDECFEIYVGEPAELCLECEEAGCEPGGSCQALSLTDWTHVGTSAEEADPC